MKISRRSLLSAGAGAAAYAALPRAMAQEPAVFAPKPGDWRRYEVRTLIEIAAAPGGVQIWSPIPAFESAEWIKPGETTWALKSGSAALVGDPSSGARMVHAVWGASDGPAGIEIVSRFMARDRAVALSPRNSGASLSADKRKLYTAATELLQTDGIVKMQADQIVAGAKTDLEKARLIYEWVVDNTFRNPKTRGCGVGDVAGMLKSGNLSGKCADLNALYVALARAAGLPARDIYGIRVAPSQFGYKSLGANSPAISKAQHCRAEVFIDSIGWVPVDPADVRKVVLEEPPGNLALADSKVVAARRALFGAWETNWLAYNDAHDVKLPGSKGPAIPFLMYPQAETAGGRLDSLDPDAFKYSITAREITG